MNSDDLSKKEFYKLSKLKTVGYARWIWEVNKVLETQIKNIEIDSWNKKLEVKSLSPKRPERLLNSENSNVEMVKYVGYNDRK